MPALKFPKSWLRTLGYRQKIHHFFFSHKWGTRFRYLSKLCPYILMYSTLHMMQWFSQLLDVFAPKIKRKFFDFYILWILKQMSLTQNLRWSLGRSIALQLQRQTDLLLCTINCFLQWDHLPNMAVGDLAFYYTLYLWSALFGYIFKGSHHWLKSHSRRQNINLACWIWPGYPALNQEYKTIVTIVLFAQIFVKLYLGFLNKEAD